MTCRRKLLLVAALLAEDWRAPPEDQEALFALAGAPKDRILFPKGDHMSLQVANPEVESAVASFLRRTMRGEPR